MLLFLIAAVGGHGTMASTTLERHSVSPAVYLPSYNGLRGYYKARNSQIVGGRNPTRPAATMSATADHCPDTSNWPAADRRNSEYIVAVHVAMAVSKIG